MGEVIGMRSRHLKGIPKTFYETAAQRTQASCDGSKYGIWDEEHAILANVIKEEQLTQLIEIRHIGGLNQNKLTAEQVKDIKQAIAFTVRWMRYFNLIKE